MAVQAVNSNQAPNPSQGVGAPQPPPREVQQPQVDQADRVNLSAEAQQKARADAARQAQEAQQQAAIQARQEATQTRATQERPRVDLIA